MINDSRIEKKLRSFFLWRDIENEKWDELYSAMTVKDIPADCMIYDESTYNCMGLIIYGDAEVYAKGTDNTRGALLRTMEAGNLFGIHCIYGNNDMPNSIIVTRKKSRVVFIPSYAWEKVLHENDTAQRNYIEFLTKRIGYLNKKISYLTVGSAEKRIAAFLINEIPYDGEQYELSLSAVDMADLLNIGRASLYRSMTNLIKKGYVERNGKAYIIHSRERLKDYIGGMI